MPSKNPSDEEKNFQNKCNNSGYDVWSTQIDKFYHYDDGGGEAILLMRRNFYCPWCSRVSFTTVSVDKWINIYGNKTILLVHRLNQWLWHRYRILVTVYEGLYRSWPNQFDTLVVKYDGQLSNSSTKKTGQKSKEGLLPPESNIERHLMLKKYRFHRTRTRIVFFAS
jgi:hypothetical protein